MGLVTPGLGLIVWMTIAFLVVWIGLGKFALPTILKSLKEREDSIDEALKAADAAKEEMKKLQASNEMLLKEARAERDILLKDGRDARDKMIQEAKNRAKEESSKLIADAREAIHNEKMAAITELKTQVAELSIEIAEKVLKQHLSDDKNQKDLVNRLVSEIKLN